MLGFKTLKHYKESVPVTLLHMKPFGDIVTTVELQSLGLKWWLLHLLALTYKVGIMLVLPQGHFKSSGRHVHSAWPTVTLGNDSLPLCLLILRIFIDPCIQVKRQ